MNKSVNRSDRVSCCGTGGGWRSGGEEKRKTMKEDVCKKTVNVRSKTRSTNPI